VQLNERQLVPVASLKDDLSIDDMKKAATPQTERVAPFENHPFSIFEEVLNNANHFCPGEAFSKHLAYGFAYFDRVFCYLVVARPVAVEVDKSIYIRSIKCVYPSPHQFFRPHSHDVFAQSLSPRVLRTDPTFSSRMASRLANYHHFQKIARIVAIA
jgi:hypothetical protein